MKRVARFYGILSILVVLYMFLWKGFSVEGYCLLSCLLIVHYGENILYILKIKEKQNERFSKDFYNRTKIYSKYI